MNFKRIGGRSFFAVIFAAILSVATSSQGNTGTTPVTVQVLPYFNYGTVSPNYNGQSLTNGKAYTMTAKTKGGFTFTGWSYTNANGSQTNSKTKLTFTNGLSFTAYFSDKQKPTISPTLPARRNSLTNAAITITGSARDNDMVSGVFYNLNDSGWTTTSTGNGWSNWWTDLTLQPNTNTLLVYAVDRSGNYSTTNKVNMTFSAAPATLTNMTMTVNSNGVDTLFIASFGSKQFSDGTGVGNFTYSKTGPVSGKLSLKYKSPPRAVGTNDATLVLNFSGPTNGSFLQDGVTYSFSLTNAEALAPVALSGANLLLVSNDDTNQSVLTLPTPPAVVDNGHLFNVANPLVILLSTVYPGATGDRVSVTFTHLQQDSAGNWYVANYPNYIGTVININTAVTNVTVLFDKSSFVSQHDMYGPTAGKPLNILTYDYTNYVAGDIATNGTGTFNYINYSPAGSLLQLNPPGLAQYCILTFTNISATNTENSGTYYLENYAPDGSFLGADSGVVGVEIPPAITTSPQDATVTNTGSAIFSVAASGSSPLSYQWQLNGDILQDGSAQGPGGDLTVSGSATATLVVSGFTTNDIPSNPATITVTVTNVFGSDTASANLTLGLPPIITSQPTDVTTSVSNNVSFTVTATTTGSAPLFYQWQTTTNLVNGTNSWGSGISGAQTRSLSITNVQPADANFYQVIVSNQYGATLSSQAKLIVQ